MSLPRTSEHLIRDHVKFRVGRMVYASVSPDEERLGFGFPKEERAALVASGPETFMMPLPSDERYQWVRARLASARRGRAARAAHRRLVHVVPKKMRPLAEKPGPYARPMPSRAIDFHVHLPTPDWLDGSMAGYVEAAEAYFRSSVTRQSLGELAACTAGSR